MTTEIYKNSSLHFKNIKIFSICFEILALCGLRISPPLLKILSTGALLAGTLSTRFATLYIKGYFCLPVHSSPQNFTASMGPVRWSIFVSSPRYWNWNWLARCWKLDA